MKKNSLILVAAAALIYITLSSDIDGAAHHGHGDVTGAPSGVAGHCQTSSCHGSNNVLTVVKLQVLDSSSMLPVTNYNPGQTYLVTLNGDATAVSTNLPGFGFMVSAVSGSHTYSGTYSIPTALASYIHTYPCGGTTVVEHSITLRQITTGTNTYATQFYWTAPTGTSDSVSFFSLLNAVNGNSASSGDYPNAAPVVTIYQNVTTSVAPTQSAGNEIAVYPNPARNQINIAYNEKITDIAILNFLGQTVYCSKNNSINPAIKISDLPSGLYYVLINNRVSAKFLKD